ncbi:MAG: ABC transporter permease, partial [Planctomycetes bacterium]|nr:ABC transporter permease [Planctomycetota bacterium]
LLANDVPLVARAGGAWYFPAFRSYLGATSQAPDGAPWKQWWLGLSDDSTDWAVMPPIPNGPQERFAGRINAAPQLMVHYLGNDDSGRDLLVRLLHGGLTALWIALGSVVLAAGIGVPLGAIAGYRGGVVDALVSALVQLFLCFPPFFFVLAVMTFLQRSLSAVVVVLGALYWVSFARIVRGELLRLRDQEFVLCAEHLGVSPTRVLVRHALPAARGPILVNAMFVAASAIVVEATLSFLGLGPGLDVVSWGGLLQQGKDNAHLGAWHLWLFPCATLVTTIAALHTVLSPAKTGLEETPRLRSSPSP